jgi:hypothetical protein
MNQGYKQSGYKNTDFSPILNSSFLHDSTMIEQPNQMALVFARFVGVGLLLMPMALQEFGLQTFLIGLVYVMFVSLMGVWLLGKAADFFNSESIEITSLHDLTYLCFGDGVILLQEAIRLLSYCILCILYFKYLAATFEDKYSILAVGLSCIFSIPCLFWVNSKHVLYFALASVILGLVCISAYSIGHQVKSLKELEEQNPPSFTVAYFMKATKLIAIQFCVFEGTVHAPSIRHISSKNFTQLFAVSMLAFATLATIATVLYTQAFPAGEWFNMSTPMANFFFVAAMSACFITY